MRKRNFIRDERGNFAMTTAIVLMPILGALAVGVDYTVMNRQKAELQNAIDAAAIAGTRYLMETGDETQLSAYTIEFARANLDPALAAKASFTVIPPDPDNGRPELRVDATLDYDPYFYGPFLKLQSPGSVEGDIIMSAATEVMPPNGGVLATLVLDNTGSMWSGNNIGALRDASVLLLDELFGDDAFPEDVRASIVPYSSAVNPGADVANALVGSHSYGSASDSDETAWKGCLMERMEPHSIADTPASAAAWQPFFYPDGIDNFYTPGIPGTIDPGPQQGNFITGPNIGCPSPITPLTNDRDSIRTDALAMSAWNRGGTLTDIGVAWGLRVMSPGEPFTESTEVDPHSAQTLWDDSRWHKFMVIMTDGESQLYNLPYKGPGKTNNAAPNNGDQATPSDYSGYGRLGSALADNILGTSNRNQAKLVVNGRIASLCADAKALGIFIYTVVFTSSVSDATKDVYRVCASEPDAYFYAPNQSSLQSAFQQIGGEMSELRISR